MFEQIADEAAARGLVLLEPSEGCWALRRQGSSLCLYWYAANALRWARHDALPPDATVFARRMIARAYWEMFR